MKTFKPGQSVFVVYRDCNDWEVASAYRFVSVREDEVFGPHYAVACFGSSREVAGPDIFETEIEALTSIYSRYVNAAFKTLDRIRGIDPKTFEEVSL